ncbi:MAG: glycosyltransferase family 4 protein [Candidatus Methylomirabilales bacterium]
MKPVATPGGSGRAGGAGDAAVVGAAPVPRAGEQAGSRRRAPGGRGVLMLLENNPYPTDPRVRAEARTLAEAGYRVTVVAPGTAGQPWREVLDGVAVYRYPAPPAAEGVWGYVWEYGYSMAAMFVLSLLVSFRHGFDVIHAHNPPDTLVLIAAPYKLFGRRFVFDHHDIAPEMYEARFPGGRRSVSWALRFFERLSFRLADHVISTNESYRTIALERGGLPPRRVTVLRNGPDLERLRPVPGDPALRRRAGTILGYVGAMGPQDGVDYLLRALAHLVHDLGRRDVHCVIVGEGDAMAGLHRLTAELGLRSHVWFPGRVPDADLVRYLCTADICLDPDPSNPFTDRSTMIKMAEYMALGKPIVAFDLPEHRVTAGGAALYARPNDCRDFACKIAELMDSPETRRRMGERGKARAETALAWTRHRHRLLAAYAALP